MDIKQYASMCVGNWEYNLSCMCPYQPFTNCYEELSKAEFEGVEKVTEYFEKVCAEKLDDYKYFTEFVLCVNHKSWEMDAREGRSDVFTPDKLEALKTLYIDLYYKAVDLFYEHYEDNSEAKRYYFEVTD